ncbi:MAG: type III polyketide synthase [Planctomycetota bacterium]|nr:type III polyketide synthase [Planctomycetota bacterium]
MDTAAPGNPGNPGKSGHPAILALGVAQPSRSIGQGRAAELARTCCRLTDQQARLLPTLYRRANVDRRASVLLEGPAGDSDEQTFFSPAVDAGDRGPTTRDRMERYAREAGPLALQAAGAALREAGADAADVGQIVVVSCTGFEAPGVDAALINGLGLATTVGRTQVGFMGCHGALNGLRTAAALAKSPAPGSPPLVLLCAVELCTLHFFYGWDPQKIVANAIFADGAAAAVIGPATSEATAADSWRIASSGSCLFPDSLDAMSWRIDDHGFLMTLSPRVPDLITQNLPAWIDRWLGASGLARGDVKSWAIHPGGPRIIKAVVECLGLPEGAGATSERVLADCGNMSSPTLLFILERLRAAGAERPCVAIGFGPGLAAEAALFL